MKIQFQNKSKGFAPVAMADIAFLLLIFLIITVNAGESGEIELPFFEYSQKIGIRDTVNIELTQDETIFLDRQEVRVDALPDRLSSFPHNTVFRIFGDQDLEYSTLDHVFTLLREAGQYHIVLITEDEEEE